MLNMHNILEVLQLLSHSPGLLSRCLLMGTSETSLSSHTSSRSCPCPPFGHFREWQVGRVDLEKKKKNRQTYLCLLHDCGFVNEVVTGKEAKDHLGFLRSRLSVYIHATCQRPIRSVWLSAPLHTVGPTTIPLFLLVNSPGNSKTRVLTVVQGEQRDLSATDSMA